MTGMAVLLFVRPIVRYHVRFAQSDERADEWSADMRSITIRNLDPAVKERLRIRAAQHGHSMEAEARSILQSTLKEPERLTARNLYERIRARFEPLGGADDLELPPRLPDHDPPRFD